MSEVEAGSAAPHGNHHDDEIHMPPNSYWPLVTSLGTAGFLLGIVYLSKAPFVMAIGALVLIVGIGGWVRDALNEYHELH